MVQVKLTGEWRRVGQVLPVRHPVLPLAVRERLFSGAAAWSSQEVTLFGAYQLIRTLWENAGGAQGDEDDNWPPPGPAGR